MNMPHVYISVEFSSLHRKLNFNRHANLKEEIQLGQDYYNPIIAQQYVNLSDYLHDLCRTSNIQPSCQSPMLSFTAKVDVTEQCYLTTKRDISLAQTSSDSFQLRLGMEHVQGQPYLGVNHIQGQIIFRGRPYLGTSHMQGEIIFRDQPYLVGYHIQRPTIFRGRPYSGTNHIQRETIFRGRPYSGTNHIQVPTIFRGKPYLGTNHIQGETIFREQPLDYCNDKWLTGLDAIVLKTSQMHLFFTFYHTQIY